jgi:L-seryl-tRNA(Ser) seleniumtransferase
MPGPTRRDLPPVHAILNRPELAECLHKHGHRSALAAVRSVLDDLRGRIAREERVDIDPQEIATRVASILMERRPSLRRVLNASGILLHTGLGRAPLAPEAVTAIEAVARGYCNLELDLDSGERGRRTSGVAELLRELTGAEAATVVNNNAAATILALRALANGREVVVSRGQLIEIGGSFRLPEIFGVSGARLREVGTTNRTRLGDYEQAIGPETAALLRVHPSNYRVVGFTESVDIRELADLARRKGVKAIDDIGSGALAPGRPAGIAGEPSITEGIQAGADLVLCSGDKLLGGPQCGLLLGTREAVTRAETDPLMRALRVDKLTLAALEATLRLALEPALASQQIPLWAFLASPVEAVRERAEALASQLRSRRSLNASAVATTAFLGAGSLPMEPILSYAVRIDPPFPALGSSAGGWSRALRGSDPPIVARVHAGALLLDLRAIDPQDDETLRLAVERLIDPLPEIETYDLDPTSRGEQEKQA